jgi:hypothetical protein
MPIPCYVRCFFDYSLFSFLFSLSHDESGADDMYNAASIYDKDELSTTSGYFFQPLRVRQLIWFSFSLASDGVLRLLLVCIRQIAG